MAWSMIEPWTSRQRVALIALVLAMLVVIAVRYASSTAFIADPQPAEPARFAELADRIDPNTADAATLSALPQIGDGRARAIVAYRELAQKRNPSRPAFAEARDLLMIRGIGAAILSQIEPYLIFPATQPTTQPY